MGQITQVISKPTATPTTRLARATTTIDPCESSRVFWKMRPAPFDSYNADDWMMNQKEDNQSVALEHYG
jgi:hypothetical protein